MCLTKTAMAYDYGEADIQPGDPTLAEIVEMCEELQKGWPEWRRRRLGSSLVTIDGGDITTVDIRVFTCMNKPSGYVIRQSSW